MGETKEVEKKGKVLKIIDRRRVGKGSPSEEPNLKPTYVQQLEEKVKRMEINLKNKIEELEDEARKSRERVKKDLEKRFEEQLEKIIIDLFDIFESIERAVAISTEDSKTKEGLILIKESLERFLEKNDVTEIDPIGEEFDPERMEALQMSEGEKNKVIKVLQKGFSRKEKVLKPAKVCVGKGENS